MGARSSVHCSIYTKGLSADYLHTYGQLQVNCMYNYTHEQRQLEYGISKLCIKYTYDCI